MTQSQELGNKHGNYPDLLSILREKGKLRLGNPQPGEHIILEYSFQGENLQPESYIETSSNFTYDLASEASANPLSESSVLISVSSDLTDDSSANSKSNDRNEERAEVFISYSHDSPEHKKRIYKLSEELRKKNGINCIIDLYVEDKPHEPWPRWMRMKVEQAKFVIVVCTKKYGERVNAGRGGVGWEGAIIEQELYDSQNSGKFICVIFDKNDYGYIPSFLRGHNIRKLDKNYENYEKEYEKLVRQLSEQPEFPMSRLGKTPNFKPIMV